MALLAREHTQSHRYKPTFLNTQPVLYTPTTIYGIRTAPASVFILPSNCMFDEKLSNGLRLQALSEQAPLLLQVKHSQT